MKDMKKFLKDNVTEDWDIYFTSTTDNFGKIETVDLIEGGSHIHVTDENKEQYVALCCERKLTYVTKQQVENFLIGFYSLIPKHLIAIFEVEELKKLIAGNPIIDIENLRNYTNCEKFPEGSQTIPMFWKIAQELSEEDKQNLLRFVTGIPIAPLGGFAALSPKFTIKFNSHKDDTHLPTASVCYHTLKLGNYDNLEKFKQQLHTAIRLGNESGFGLS